MDDYLDEDAVVYDPQEIAWWKEHKELGHRVDWPNQGVPICYTCGVIYLPSEKEEQR